MMQMFEKACRKHSEELYRYICVMTNNDFYAAEEIYQNTMLGAWKGLKDLRDTRKMKAWIFAIAKAESGRYYSHVKGRQLHHMRMERDLGGCEGLYDFTKYVEDQECIRNLMKDLSGTEQQIYILHYYYDMPLKGISELLNLNYNTIRSMHMRGMTKMRKRIPAQEFHCG